MQSARSSPPLRQALSRTLATVDEDGGNNNNKTASHNNSDESRQSQIHHIRWSIVGDDAGHHSPSHCPSRHVSSKDSDTSRPTQLLQQEQQEQPKPPPALQTSTTPPPNTTSLPPTTATKFSLFQLWSRNMLFMSSSTTQAPAGPVSPGATLPPMGQAITESNVTQELPSTSLPPEQLDRVLNDSPSSITLASALKRALMPSMSIRPTFGPSSSSPSPPSANCMDTLDFDGSSGSCPGQQMCHARLKPTAASCAASSFSTLTFASTSDSSSSVSSSASSTPTSPSLQSNTTRIRNPTPDSSTDLGSGDTSEYSRSNGSSRSSSSDGGSSNSFVSKSAATSRQQALVQVQERIVHGRNQLEHFHLLVLGLEQERNEAIELCTGMKRERDALALEIEVLENATTLDPTSVAAGESIDTQGRYHSLFSNTAISSPTSLKRDNSESAGAENVDIRTCCSSDGSSKPIASTIVTTPSPMETTPASSSSSSSGPSTPMCHRCWERRVYADKRMRLNQVQGDVERAQQRIRFLGSQMKNIGRTFIKPIESCLAIDREEWTRLLAQADRRP